MHASGDGSGSRRTESAVMSSIVRCRQSERIILPLHLEISEKILSKLHSINTCAVMIGGTQLCLLKNALEINFYSLKITSILHCSGNHMFVSVEQSRCRKADGLVSAKLGWFIRMVNLLCERATNSVPSSPTVPEITCSIVCRPPKYEYGTDRCEFGVVFTSMFSLAPP